MNQPHDGTHQEQADSMMGPAVPPAGGRPSPEPLPEPLAPFLGGFYELGGEPPETEEQPEKAPAPGSARGADAELPWLMDERQPASGTGEAPTYMGGVPEVSLEEGDGIVPIDSLRPDDAPSEVAAPDAAAGLQPTGGVVSGSGASELGAPDPGASDLSASEAPPVPAAPWQQQGVRDLHVEQAGGFVEPGSPVLEEVAARLEGIARSLRTRNPADLLAGSSDPLEILVVGYVLGVSQARRTGGEVGREI